MGYKMSLLANGDSDSQSNDTSDCFTTSLMVAVCTTPLTVMEFIGNSLSWNRRNSVSWLNGPTELDDSLQQGRQCFKCCQDQTTAEISLVHTHARARAHAHTHTIQLTYVDKTDITWIWSAEMQLYINRVAIHVDLYIRSFLFFTCYMYFVCLHTPVLSYLTYPQSSALCYVCNLCHIMSVTFVNVVGKKQTMQ